MRKHPSGGNADPTKIPAKPSRWRFQFSLKMLFLLTALAAVLLSWWRVKKDTREFQNRERTTAFLRDGIIHVNAPTVNDRAIADAIARTARGGPIRGMTIWGERFELTSEGWSEIERLKLKSLRIGWKFDDGLVARLGELSSLEELTFFPSGCREVLTPSRMRHLREALPNCRVTIYGEPPGSE